MDNQEDFLTDLRPFLSTGLPLIGNVLKLLGKNVLIPLGLTAAAAATDSSLFLRKCSDLVLQH